MLKNLLTAIYQGADVETVGLYLQANPKLLNEADAQGNTLLHYAVAQHNLALVEFLIKQGADVQARNYPEEGEEGKTAAEWFQEYIASTYYYSEPAQFHQLEVLREEIAENNIQFIASALNLGVSRALRFSQGKTLLHFAVEAQQTAIIELMLQGVSYQDVARLLHAKDSQGVTPLALAQQLCQAGTRPAREIFSYLQEKQRLTAVPGDAALTPQKQHPGPLAVLTHLDCEEVKALADLLSRPLKSADFVRLNPLRVTLVKLAYNNCLQALRSWYQFFPDGKVTDLGVLLERLFGVWNATTAFNFRRKLRSVSDYLDFLVQQNQVDQVVHFSAEKLHVEGRCCHADNKIFLNSTKTNVAALVLTLIHEVSHKVARSYDFFAADCYTNKQGCFINLERAFRLAAIGVAGELTLEQRKIFEVRQLLEEGFSDSWQKNIHRWMALNSAETLAVAIVTLAAVPQGTATIRSDAILHIRPQFLQDYAVAKPSFMREVWNRIYPPRRSPNKDPSSRSAPLDAEQPLVSPASPATLSTASGGSGSSPNTSTLGSPSLQSESFSLSPLQQAMAAQTSSAAVAGPLGALSSETSATAPSPLASPSKSPLSPKCPVM